MPDFSYLFVNLGHGHYYVRFENTNSTFRNEYYFAE